MHAIFTLATIRLAKEFPMPTWLPSTSSTIQSARRGITPSPSNSRSKIDRTPGTYCLTGPKGERIADPAAEIALEDAERLRERLQRGAERVFSVYIQERASSRRDLDELTRRVEMLLDGMLARSRRALWEQEQGFRSCLPEGRDELMEPRNLDTSALAATLPFVGSSLSMDNGMLYGVSIRTQAPVIIDPFDELAYFGGLS